MNTEIKKEEKVSKSKKEPSNLQLEPATKRPGIKAVYDSVSRQLHGAHGIGCRN